MIKGDRRMTGRDDVEMTAHRCIVREQTPRHSWIIEHLLIEVLAEEHLAIPLRPQQGPWLRLTNSSSERTVGIHFERLGHWLVFCRKFLGFYGPLFYSSLSL